MATDINPLYVQNPGTVNSQAAKTGTIGEAATKDAITTPATSTGYNATTNGALSQGALADGQLNRITSQDSSYIKQARQSGMLSAAQRGLQNSSIAAGASEASAVAAAAPLAQQNAAAQASQDQADQNAVNRAGEFKAGADNAASSQNAALNTQTSLANSQSSNRASEINAAALNQNNQFNASQQQQSDQLNAAAANEMRTRVIAENAAFNRQYLTGSQSQDLETIRQNYDQMIQTNSQAAGLYSSYMNGIFSLMQNTNIAPDRLAVMISAQQTQLQAGLDLISKINRINFDPVAPDKKTVPATPAPGAAL